MLSFLHDKEFILNPKSRKVVIEELLRVISNLENTDTKYEFNKLLEQIEQIGKRKLEK